MAEFDFPNAQLPKLFPLDASHAANELEAELKALTLELFEKLCAKQAFDANVTGMAHLSSFDQVRRLVNQDGLALLPGASEEAATRYLYRAWKSRGENGRGLHFLRTYLQMLFPNQCEVEQLWHDKSLPYSTAAFANAPVFSWWLNYLGKPGLKIDGTWQVGQRIPEAAEETHSRTPDVSGMFLTSRILITLGFDVETTNTSRLLHIIRQVIPARFVPLFKFWLRFVLHVAIRIDAQLLMQKNTRLRYPWCGRVISDHDDTRWKLGVDGDVVRLPQRIGHFKVGSRVGGKSVWRLKHCRIQSEAAFAKHSEAPVWGMPQLGQAWRRVDGAWQLSRRMPSLHSLVTAAKSFVLQHTTSVQTTFHDHISITYPASPSKIGSMTALELWRKVDGAWRVGAPVKDKPLPALHIGRGQPVLIEGTGALQLHAQAHVMTEKLLPSVVTQIKATTRKLNGLWALGAENRIGRFALDGRALRSRKLHTWPRLGAFSIGLEGEDSKPAYQAPERSLTLDGAWRVGGKAAPVFKLQVLKV